MVNFCRIFLEVREKMQELKNGVIVSSFVGSNGHIGRVLVKTNLTLIISRVEDITWRIDNMQS